ncbi:MAG TPA: prepilin-type N-terminal cleavage/methylation domain-containing protein [Methylomirabilota bacterium]|nr:prepilin-type N-terminal cleavage/methylation domain-containing protein [Methylomirabilota bacterium]
MNAAVRRLVSDHRGMTLAEVLVALPIITIGLLALLAAIPLSTFATQEGKQSSTATFLANQRLEQVRNAQWSAVPAVDQLGISASAASAPQTGGTVTFADENPVTSYAGYQRRVRVTDCGAGGGCAGVTSSGMRLVTVTVTYAPLSPTGKDAPAPRSVAVTMLVAQR